MLLYLFYWESFIKKYTTRNFICFIENSLLRKKTLHVIIFVLVRIWLIKKDTTRYG